MTRKIIYSSIIAILLLSGCSKDDSGGDDTPAEERAGQVETNTQNSNTENQGSSSSTIIENSTTEQNEVTNQAPTVDAGADTTVTVNEALTITGSASDSDGTIVSYEWTKNGEVLATNLSFSYIATVVGTDVLTLVVVDDDGISANSSVNIIVESDEESSDFEIK